MVAFLFSGKKKMMGNKVLERAAELLKSSDSLNDKNINCYNDYLYIDNVPVIRYARRDFMREYLVFILPHISSGILIGNLKIIDACFGILNQTMSSKFLFVVKDNDILSEEDIMANCVLRWLEYFLCDNGSILSLLNYMDLFESLRNGIPARDLNSFAFYPRTCLLRDDPDRKGAHIVREKLFNCYIVDKMLDIMDIYDYIYDSLCNFELALKDEFYPFCRFIYDHRYYINHLKFILHNGIKYEIMPVETIKTYQLLLYIFGEEILPFIIEDLRTKWRRIENINKRFSVPLRDQTTLRSIFRRETGIPFLSIDSIRSFLLWLGPTICKSDSFLYFLFSTVLLL